MSRRLKLTVLAATTTLVALVVAFLVGYARLECLEYDPCPTGGPMPYASLAAIGSVVLAAVWAWVLWRCLQQRNEDAAQ